MKNNSLKLNLTIFILILFVASIGFAACGINIYYMNDDVMINASEVDGLTPSLPLTSEIVRDGDSCKVEYKVCKLLPFKSVNINVTDKKVYLGGKPLGLSMRVGGLIVTQKIDVLTDVGLVSPSKNLDIQSGDILIAINGVKVANTVDVTKIINSAPETVTITLRRDSEILNYNITPALDSLSNTKKLGLWLRADIEGIGTLTYIDKETKHYGALGHVIKDCDSGVVYDKPNGSIFDATIYGVVKGERGKAGELSGGFNKSETNIGTLEKNCDFGVFGQYYGNTAGMEEIQLGCKYAVRPGRAQILTTLDGETPKRYDIEIVKSSRQNTAKTRGLLLRVTDKELLEKAGGIVQGMSGSPIIQDGKLVGAVTHVFIGDPTKGYGTYIDWMLPN